MIPIDRAANAVRAFLLKVLCKDSDDTVSANDSEMKVFVVCLGRAETCGV